MTVMKQQSELNRDEEGRLEELHSYQVLDSLDEEEFDNLTRLASEIAGVPIAMVNLIDEDRQWSKSVVGIPKQLREVPREQSVCQYTIREDGVTEIIDLSEDPRTAELEHIREDDGLRYYLGVPLLTKNNYAIGTLCVLDFESRKMTELQVHQLKIIAKEVMTHLELRKKNKELERLNEYKLQLMKMLSHDMRSPLNGIIGLTSMLREQLEEEGSDHVETVDVIEQSSSQLNQMIDEVMNYSILESGGVEMNPSEVNLQSIVENIIQLYRPATKIKDIDLEFYTEGLEDTIWLDGDKFEQIMGNLLSNAIKYTPTGGWVKMSVIKNDQQLEMRVSDSGIGMSKNAAQNLFERKQVHQSSKGTSGEKSTGLGLTIIRQLIDLFDGDIDVQSRPGKGTTVEVFIPLSD